jgi:threonine dehydrogenase-like Zn-dependent dehydrogenase
MLPEDLSAENGVFLAATETALSLAQDAAPVRGELVGVWGLGTVGLLTSSLLSGQVLAWDVLANRRQLAESRGIRVVRPGPASCDVVVELTGNPAALNEALRAARFGGRVVLGSWYGARPVEAALGGEFHRSRIEMISSQVSTIAPQLSGRWTKSRRLETALRLVAELRPETLVTHRFPLAEAARAYEQACDHPETGSQVLLTY